MNTQNINQFSQQPVRGQLDLHIMKSGVISGVSSDGVNTLHPGDRVKLDNANTGATPAFKKAAITENAIGTVAYNVKKSAIVSGDFLEVAIPGGIIVQFQEGGETLAPGAEVEFNSSDKVIAYAASTSKKAGVVLDALTNGALGRVLMTPTLV